MPKSITAHNNSNNISSKYASRQLKVGAKISKTPKDEVCISQNNKKKGGGILKTIFGFGGAAAIGGFVGKLFANKNLARYNILDDKYDNISNIIDDFGSSKHSIDTYHELSKIIGDVCSKISEPECYAFEGEDTIFAKKVVDFISEISNKACKVIDLKDGTTSLDSALAERKNPKIVELFKLKNLQYFTKDNLKEKNGETLQKILTNTQNKNIYFCQANELKQEHGYFRSIELNNLSDFDNYTKLWKEFIETDKKIDKILELKKLNLPAIGIAAGLAIATAIFAILKIKNKGEKNENIAH